MNAALVSAGVEGGSDEMMIPLARSLRIEQKGEFLLNDQWVRFDATQEFSCRQKHPGFVWDCRIHNPCFGVGNLTFPISVRDAFIHGVGGTMMANLPMGIPVVSMKARDDDLDLGKITYGQA